MKNLFLATLLLFPSLALGQSGHWFDASHPGHGIQINRDSGFGYAVTWYLYRKDGTTAFLTGETTCEEFPCVIALVEPSASFMGGNLELGDPVGTLELTLTGDGNLDAQYDLISWLKADCAGILVGGLLFRKCIGTIELEKLAD